MPTPQQQVCTRRNVKGSPSGKRKIGPYGNMDLPKGVKNTINSNYMENIYFSYYLNLFKDIDYLVKNNIYSRVYNT